MTSTHTEAADTRKPAVMPIAYAAVAVQAVTIASSAALVVAGWPGILASGEWGFPGFQAVCAIVVTASAWPIRRVRPDNPIGWLLLTVATSSAVQSAVHYQAQSGDLMTSLGLPGPAVGAWAEGWVWIPTVSAAMAALLLFPTGRVPTPRWRPALWVIGAGTAACLVGLPVAFWLVPAQPGAARQIPTASASPVTWLIVAGFTLIIAGSALAAIATVSRFRHSTGIERQQLKWLALAGALFLLTFPLYMIAVETGGAAIWWEAATAASFLGVPAAVATAIVRHRLFDIDRVINRTVVYLTLTAMLALVYFVTVLALQAALAGVTRTSELAVATSTLLVAALFQPARRRIQAGVDRRFYRSRYDGLRIADAFARRLRDEVELDAVTRDVGRTVEHAIRPTTVGVWVRPTTGSIDRG
jgi:hypothetical protein